ncbi:MAG: 2-oxo-4-hydroxy-4-carboxy-5-ureidoimidazoline decarboxylase [Pelagibacteraceae bacterium]|jgi:2-oxo-4-hydroxy-4-carboxy-5-ureidoimidazoline decarboxylase|nr:2-oxo-4-hydroxy-4-carboxy-5-ureidoimidazoline decarboxylase [Pelagibacteraceae bacterium]|tara:strand:- start:16889 stop:17395 length:507 start_codon:yes stop_codon:yes gene_type:complete
MILINKINNLSQIRFNEIFANIFEKTKWIAEKLYNQKPFNSFEDLCSKILEIFRTTSKKNQLKIIRAHPDLADKTKISLLNIDSRNEQNRAGLDQCSEKEFREFKNLNNEYKKKFGFPFILAVEGKNKTEILNKFKKRILNSADDEFKEAISQVCKIANLRLNKINIK